MPIPLILGAVARVAAGTAIRGAATRAVAGGAARGVGGGALRTLGSRGVKGMVARSALISTVKGATTAPSGTVPGVLRKQENTNVKTAAPTKTATIIQFPTGKVSGQNSASNGMGNSNATNMSRESCCDQSVGLLEQIRDNTNPDSNTATKCCETGNDLLASIDDTLKKMLAQQHQMMAMGREADAEAQDKPAPGFGGIKEKAEEIKANLFGALLKTGFMLLVTNLKPIAKFIGDATKALGDAAGYLANEAGKLFDNAMKDIQDGWKTMSENVGNWWNETSNSIGNWWNNLWGGGNEEKDAEKPAPVAPPVSPAPSANRNAAAVGSSLSGAGAGVKAPAVINPTPKTNNESGVPEALIKALNNQGITDPKARANILGQVKAESEFKVTTETNWDKTSNKKIRESVFANRVKDLSEAELTKLKQDPEAFFNYVYGDKFKVGRDMGNTKQGDGYRYRGRGYIQLTGKNNYDRIGKMIGQDLVGNPDLMLDPKIAAEATVAFMKSRNVDLRDNNALTKAVTGNSSQQVADYRSQLATSFVMQKQEKVGAINSDAIQTAANKSVVSGKETISPVVIQSAQGGKVSQSPMSSVASTDAPKMFYGAEQFPHS